MIVTKVSLGIGKRNHINGHDYSHKRDRRFIEVAEGGRKETRERQGKFLSFRILISASKKGR